MRDTDITTAQQMAFWSRVDKRPGDGCWLWTGPANARGYGHVRVTQASLKITVRRMAWILKYRCSPHKNQYITLSCKNTLCVRHLKLRHKSKNTMEATAQKRILYRKSIVLLRRRWKDYRKAYGWALNVRKRFYNQEAATLGVSVNTIRKHLAR